MPFKESQSLPRPLSELLSQLSRQERIRSHPIARYIEACKAAHWLITSVVAVGGDSIVFKIDNGNILHITNKVLSPLLGSRFFDLPMLERGAFPSPGGITVEYFIQPRAQTPVSEREIKNFQRLIEPHGWLLADSSQHQLGIFKEETKLLDPFAVEPIPDFGQQARATN